VEGRPRAPLDSSVGGEQVSHGGAVSHVQGSVACGVTVVDERASPKQQNSRLDVVVQDGVVQLPLPAAALR